VLLNFCEFSQIFATEERQTMWGAVLQLNQGCWQTYFCGYHVIMLQLPLVAIIFSYLSSFLRNRIKRMWKIYHFFYIMWAIPPKSTKKKFVFFSISYLSYLCHKGVLRNLICITNLCSWAETQLTSASESSIISLFLSYLWKN
jgi:hypothetical protein